MVFTLIAIDKRVSCFIPTLTRALKNLNTSLDGWTVGKPYMLLTPYYRVTETYMSITIRRS